MRHNLISWLKVKVFFTILVIFLLKMGTMAQVIPYPNALNSAAIVQPSICNVDTNGIIIGNGDLKVESTNGGELRLVSPWKSIVVKCIDCKQITLDPDSMGIVQVSTTKGQKLEFFEK